MIRVLLVEDSDLVVEQVRGWLTTSSPSCELLVATNRDDALLFLSGSHDFDLIVCDLHIPPRSESLDGREEYGMEVHSSARTQHRGTPCLFLTGHADHIDTHDELSAGGVEDIFGTGDLIPMVRLIRKLYSDRAGDYISNMANEVAALDSIGLDAGGLELDAFSERAIRIFLRRHKAVSGVLRPLGGLSGAKTFSLRAFDQEGARRALAFGKVSTRTAVEDEERRFQQFVSVHLDPSCTPVLAGHVLGGAGRRAAIFYSFAERYDRSLFDVIREDPTTSVEMLATLRSALEPWHNTGMRGTLDLGVLRDGGIHDDALREWLPSLGDLDMQSIEAWSAACAIGPQHGDLHGGNVLVDTDGRVLVIDFGDVDRRCLGFDPVTLELSLLFHPDRPNEQPVSPDACAHWASIDEYADVTPFGQFVRACRAWSIDAAGEVAVMGIAYAHALRQLKYADTPKDVALKVAVAAGSRLLELI
jgi:CheY-like chemotaxis protein